MTTKRRNDDTTRWTLTDWSRAFDAGESPATRQTKAREHTSLSYTDRLRDQVLGPALEPGDSWDAKDYVRWAKEHPDESDKWLDATDIVATLDRQQVELGVTSAQHDREREERQAQRDLEQGVEYRAAIARLELKAAEARRTLGDEEITRRYKAMQARWNEEFAALKAWRAECKAARAKGKTASDLPPHPLHNKAGWQKWQESQRLLRFRPFNRGMLH